MSSASHSVNVAIFFSVLFLIVSHPLTYKLTHRLFKPLFSVADKSGCASMHGILLHTLVFGVVVFLISYFFGSSRMEMMTDMSNESSPMADAMYTPAPSESEMVMDTRMNQEDEENINAGYSSPNSQMKMPLQYQETQPQGPLAMGPEDYEASPVSGSQPAQGLTMPQNIESNQPMAAEGFNGYAPVF